ncbi:ABC transporter ATP-binding protein [Thermohalobacter berrensis]|uniref:ABC transporter domain-containing protein n=1 Tax=Thermohalobacter berrensis TaxID=99594 RepID=A0A419SV44_9FIRM|nr:ABC transporter ATP-binding protein [Thermohalobacter berrensis]RKD29091.1 hypothetical protein BET03_05960 [Thermohalobacter berrensis]
MTEAIKVKSLYFGYGDNHVLKDINFTIKKGDFVSIIGPNGSGKSTLLKNIANILKPEKGIIEVDGKNIIDYSVKELAKKIALVPQDTHIAYEFNVFDIVLMGRNPYLKRFERETDKDFQIAKESLKLTDTLHLKDKGINNISGGERQRVIISRALAQQPKILLLDEPTSHLDINHQIDILSLLQKLNKEKEMTIVVVIHDINLAARFSNKIILLNKGEVLSIGNPKEVINYNNLENTYNLDMIITDNPYTNSPYIIPLTSKEKNNYRKINKKVHVICGGGTGGEVLNKLDLFGYRFSVGVINIGDSDWQLGKKLSAELIEEMPFTGITDKAYKKNVATMEKSDVVVLTSVPYGKGNFKNLEAAYKALEKGKPVYLIDNYQKYKRFDYVNGKAKKILDDMKKKGLKLVNSVDELLLMLKKHV